MNILLTEINRNRQIMGLPILNEGILGILDDIILKLEATTVKKITAQVVDQFANSFSFGNAAAKTRFINGGLTSLKTALSKIPKKQALEIIISTDERQIANLANYIANSEKDLVGGVTDLILKGVPDSEILKSFTQFSEIPKSVVKQLIRNIEAEKLFTKERILAIIKSLSTSKGKSLSKLTQEAINVARKANPNMNEQEIAEYFSSKLPASLFTPENIKKVLGDVSNQTLKILSYTYTHKGELSYKKLGLTAVMAGLIYGVWKLTNPLEDDISKIERLYPDITGVTPTAKPDVFTINYGGTRVNVKFKDTRLYFIDSNNNILEPVPGRK
jgi:hypothetical protein